MENIQTQLILEIIHQAISNLVYAFDLKNNYLYEDDSWSSILADTALVVCSMYPTILQDMTEQLVFGRNMMINTTFIDDWGAISIFKQELMD